MLIPGTRHDWKRKCKVEIEAGEMLGAMMRGGKAGLLLSVLKALKAKDNLYLLLSPKSHQ